jgi:hypothetical protein
MKVSATTGRSDSSFAFAGLVDGSYRLVAWRDVNKNRKVDAGDWLGSSKTASPRGTLRPPASGVGLTLERVTGISSVEQELIDALSR